jgi:hypothetical protein
MDSDGIAAKEGLPPQGDLGQRPLRHQKQDQGRLTIPETFLRRVDVRRQPQRPRLSL